MQLTKIKVLGFEADYEVPENAEEFDLLAKKQGASFQASLKQELAHGSYGTIRANLCALLEGEEIVHPKDENRKHKLAEPLGKRQEFLRSDPVSSEETVVDGKKVTVYYNSKGKKLSEEQVAQVATETEKAFVDRILATVYGGDRGKMYPLFLTAVEFSPFDPSATERKEATARIPKTWLKAAQEIVEAGAQHQVAEQLAAIIGRPVEVTGLDNENAVAVLAQAIWENEQREAQLRKGKYLAMRG